MPIEIRQKFEQLSKSTGRDIAQSIIELTEQLEGKSGVLRAIIDKKSGPLGYKSYDSEDLALRVLLLCLVWTTLDPYIVNTPIGTKQKMEIELAASLLDVPTTDLGALCQAENELFLTLSSLLKS